MTDPRMNQEPARKPSEEEVNFIFNAAFTVFHCFKAEEVSTKSACAECGSNHGIEADPREQSEAVINGIVSGKCRKCGAHTTIGFYYDNEDDFMASKPAKVYRVSDSTVFAPVSVPF